MYKTPEFRIETFEQKTSLMQIQLGSGSAPQPAPRPRGDIAAPALPGDNL